MNNEPIEYNRLMKIAKAMHTWIFLHCGDEEEVYREIGLTERENAVLGWGDKLEIEVDNG